MVDLMDALSVPGRHITLLGQGLARANLENIPSRAPIEALSGSTAWRAAAIPKIDLFKARSVPVGIS